MKCKGYTSAAVDDVGGTGTTGTTDTTTRVEPAVPQIGLHDTGRFLN